MNTTKLAKFLLEGHGCVDCEKVGGAFEMKEGCLIKQGTPEKRYCKFWSEAVLWPRPAKRN